MNFDDKFLADEAIQWQLYIAIYNASLVEKATATHSSTLAWKISWTEEPGRQQSMGL